MEVFVIVPPRIEEGFSNLDPTQVSDEFDDGEHGHEDDRRVVDEGTDGAEPDVETFESFLIFV